MRKYDKVLLHRLNDWFYEQGFDCEFRRGDRFETIASEGVIYIPLHITEHCDFFMEHLKKKGLRDDWSETVMSILHEVGHTETMPYDMTDDEKFNDFLCIQALTAADAYTEDTFTAYWNTKTESLANEWAIEMANDYPDLIKELENVLAAFIRWDQVESGLQ